MGSSCVFAKCAEEGSEGDARVEARGIEGEVVRFVSGGVVWREEWEERVGEKGSLKCCHSSSFSFPSSCWRKKRRDCCEEEQDARNVNCSLIQHYSNWRRLLIFCVCVDFYIYNNNINISLSTNT